MRQSSESGFSMVELAVVFFLIIALAAALVPGIAGYLRNYQIRGATQDVAAELQNARLQAVKRNVNRGVVFSIVSDTEYQFFVEDNPGQGDQPIDVMFVDVNDPGRDPGGPYEDLGGPRRRLPTGLQFVPDTGPEGDCAVRFDRMGRVCRPHTSDNDPALPIGCVSEVNAGTGCAGANYIEVPDAQNGATITIRQPSTGLTRTITLTSGGRVLAQP
jgi:type II secretory pathway pseudopilin PulG